MKNPALVCISGTWYRYLTADCMAPLQLTNTASSSPMSLPRSTVDPGINTFYNNEMLVSCHFFNIDCFENDQIYTGSDDSGMLLAQLCNQNAQKQQVSTTGNQMFIRFTTDENVNGGGFNATYLSNPGGL